MSTAALIQAARDAASAATTLAREAARQAGPDMPLAAYHGPLRDLGRALSSASGGLDLASRLAAAVIGPGPSMTDAVPGKLAVAGVRASQACDHAAVTRAAIGRELRRASTEPGTSPTQLSRPAAAAWHCLDSLERDLQAARPAGTSLDVLMDIAFQQAVILEQLSDASERLSAGVAGACGRIPGATTLRTTRASRPLQRASETLRKAAVVTTRAHGDLADEVTRQRKAGTRT